MLYALEFTLIGPTSRHRRKLGIELIRRAPTPEAFAEGFASFVREAVEDCVRADQQQDGGN